MFVSKHFSSISAATTMLILTVGKSISTFLPMPCRKLTSLCFIRFSVASTHLVARSYVTDRDPLVAADIQRREERCRRNGGIGTAVVLIQCGSISQVMPVEVDPPSKISWDVREDWADVLRHFVDSGRSDFKPISTSSRGSVAYSAMAIATSKLTIFIFLVSTTAEFSV